MVLTSVVSEQVFAAGLEVPDLGTAAVGRGGAFVARADDATAVYHNPAAIARLRGLHVTWNHNLLWANSQFTRAETEIPITASTARDPNSPVENESSLFPLGAFVAATYDFGLENFGFGLSVFGPSGTGKIDFPTDGGQRYMMTSFEAMLAYYNVSAAWKSEKFGFGVTLQYADLWYLNDSMVVDGQPGGNLNPYASTADVEATVKLKDRTAFTMLVGAWWKPLQWLELGASGRVIPVFFDLEGHYSLRNVAGGTTFTEEQLNVANPTAKMQLTLPPTAKLGARYIHDRFDVELDVVYEAWSTVGKFNIDMGGYITLLANEPAQDVRINKNWRDTISVRLGSTFNITDRIDVSAGALYEQGAVPKNYSHVDITSFDRVGLSAGFKVSLLDQLDLRVAYSHLFQEDRDVSERYGKVIQQRPVAQCPGDCNGLTGVIANAGHFETSYDLLSFAIEWRSE